MSEQRTFTFPHDVSIVLWFVLICGIFGGYVALLSTQGLDVQRSELEYLRAENADLAAHNRDIQAQLHALREQYGVTGAVSSDPSKAVQTDHQRSFEYTVQKGDTIWDIAMMYNVDVKALMRWNNLNPRSQIFPGDTLTIILQE